MKQKSTQAIGSGSLCALLLINSLIFKILNLKPSYNNTNQLLVFKNNWSVT
jgi:hypothetical protein